MKLAEDIQVGDKVYKAGSECPKSEELRLLLHNREFLVLKYENGSPVVPKEYASYFNEPKPIMKIKQRLYSQENLTIKLNKLGKKEFGVWAEKTFGEEKIDRREKAKKIINEILRLQEAERR